MEEKLKFTEEAKLDIKEAATYYNEVESHKLADDFLSSINEKIIQILIKPKLSFTKEEMESMAESIKSYL